MYFLLSGLGPPSFLLMEVFFWEILFVQNTYKCLQYFLKITHNFEASEHIELKVMIQTMRHCGKKQTIETVKR